MSEIVSKLQKLIAHEESARKMGSIAEATIFAAKIAELMQNHNLEMSDVEVQEEDDNSPVGKTYVTPGTKGGKVRSGRSKWRETLAQAVAASMFCKLLVVPGKATLCFCGREEQREAAVMLFNYLHDLCNQMNKSEYKRYAAVTPMPQSSHDYRHSFTVGFADAVHHRLYSDLQALRGSTEKGLVLVNRHELAIRSFLGGRPKMSNSIVRSVGGDAYHVGYARGSAVNLKANKALKG